MRHTLLLREALAYSTPLVFFANTFLSKLFCLFNFGRGHFFVLSGDLKSCDQALFSIEVKWEKNVEEGVENCGNRPTPGTSILESRSENPNCQDTEYKSGEGTTNNF